MTAPRRAAGLYADLKERLSEGSPDGEREGVWDELAELVDPASSRPRLAPDIEVKRFPLRSGNDYAIAANPRDLVFYRLEPWEADLLPLMDGVRTVKDILVERLQGSGDLEMSGVADLVWQLRVGNFLTEPFVDVQDQLKRALQPASTGRAKAREFAKTLSIEWTGAHRLVAWCHRYLLRWFFIPWVAVLATLAAIGGFGAFVALWREGRFTLSTATPGAESLVLLALSYFLTFAHELGHATVLVHFGRRVKSAGFMIYFGSPSFFVESSDALMLDRWQRILQSFGGPFTELIIAGAAAALAWAFPDAWIAPVLYKFALLNYFVILLNLVPMLELDGYWILSDLIQVPDLRPRSLQFMRYDLWRKLRGRESFTKQEIGLALYGTLGVVFTIISLYWSVIFWQEIFGGLVSELWNGGTAGRILLLALALFLIGPVIRGLIALIRNLARKARALWSRIRFKLETSWRVEAARLIDAIPIFEDLPADILSDLAGRVRLLTVPAGKPVFRQGDRPDAFYVVRRGTLHVIEEDPDAGTERLLRALGRGESFGELGLVVGTPRSATVRAVEDTQLFAVDEGTFDRLLADTVHLPEFAPTLQRVAELRQLPAFAALSSEDLSFVMEHGEWRNVPPGETLIEEGEVGDGFYAIRSGQVEVVHDDEVVSTLGPGSHFGEIALLMDVPRTATVVARTPVRVFRLDREGFDRAVAQAFRRGTLDPTVPLGRTWQH